MELKRVLDYIGDERRPLSSGKLYSLSHLSSEELQFFAERWTTISTTRRREIVAALVEIAEANITVDFGHVFRLALRDEDGEVRAQAVDGLWEDESPGLAGLFLEMLISDPFIVARAAAATALGRYVFLAELEELDEELGRSIVQALRRVIEDTTEALEPRRRAVEAIGFSGEEGVQGLIEAAYRNPVEKMRVSAVFSMGRSADQSWGPTVLDELESTNPEMRFEAARAAGELELKEAVPSLITLIGDSDREVQQAAISALGKIGGSEARSALRLCCQSEDEVIAAAADEALGELELTAGLFETFLDDEEL
jgi:HEAT repeat protein